MLLWEHLAQANGTTHQTQDAPSAVVHQTKRLPFDLRCAALTRTGKRCRGRVLRGKDWCVFHDPETAVKRQVSARRSQARGRSRLARLPDGYLRKITNRRSVGQAMDRLYREIRLGIITPEMGRVLFDVLTRILDSGLADGSAMPRSPERSKAARVRPRISELLTRAERLSWKQALDNAPDSVFGEEAPRIAPSVPKPVDHPGTTLEHVERALTLPVHAAS